jgi:hypothetical protein
MGSTRDSKKVVLANSRNQLREFFAHHIGLEFHALTMPRKHPLE